MPVFEERKKAILADYNALIARENIPLLPGNGIFTRYQYPILTKDHAPPTWIFDFDPETNPFFMERMGINVIFNSGAIYFNDKILLVARVEGSDRKSFFAIAESDNGIDHFRFRDFPMEIPESPDPDINVYDMRLTEHEDGWIYGVFCTERKDPEAPASDTSSAVAQCGIIRTKDMESWERLPDLQTPSRQQRNCVLHPEFVNAQYAFYTRPQDDFIDPGSGGGIGWGLTNSIENPIIHREEVIDARRYHTIKEVKNGQGPPPLKTSRGWLHLAHGVRNTAAGLRYVLYMFITDLKDPTKVIHAPGGLFLEPQSEERVGDVSNVVFSNGWVRKADGTIFIYYGSSDTRMHVATSTEAQLLDYALHTPEDPGKVSESLSQRMRLIQKNNDYLTHLK